MLLWRRVVYDSPGLHPRVSQQERAAIQAALDDERTRRRDGTRGSAGGECGIEMTTRQLYWAMARAPAVWAVCTAAFCLNIGGHAPLRILMPDLEPLFRV